MILSFYLSLELQGSKAESNNMWHVTTTGSYILYEELVLHCILKDSF